MFSADQLKKFLPKLLGKILSFISTCMLCINLLFMLLVHQYNYFMS
ncbi:hypothetical protein EMIT0180MI3_20498 [Priestia megaterium]